MRNHSFSDIPWFAIVLSFVFFWPLGVFLLISKLGAENITPEQREKWKNDLKTTTNRAKQEFHSTFGAGANQPNQPLYTDPKHSPAQGGASSHHSTTGTYNATASGSYPNAGTSGTYQHKTQSAQHAPLPNKNIKKTFTKIKSGHGFTIMGLVIMFLFGIATISSFAAAMPNLLYAVKDSAVAFSLTGVGAGLFAFGRFKHKQAKKFRKMFNLIGSNEIIDIHTLAEAMPCDYEQACNIIQKMIDNGHLGKRAYINMSTGELFMYGEGLKVNDKPKKKKAADKDEAEELSLLQQIRHVNQAIPDPTLTRKIDRIEEITGHILAYQKKHPEKATDLRKFLNYYLPTTLKILNTYAELDRQGINGENISATKSRIEGMIDMVVEGFETQLDKLFAGDMLDISSDIAVMEKMMNSDGLAGGMKMPTEETPKTGKPKHSNHNGQVDLTLDPSGNSGAQADNTALHEMEAFLRGGGVTTAPAPNTWEDGFYRKVKEELK